MNHAVFIHNLPCQELQGLLQGSQRVSGQRPHGRDPEHCQRRCQFLLAT